VELNWSTVNNLLITILIAANLFLVFNILRREHSRHYLDDETVSDAISLLREKGLDVDENSVPLRKFDALVYESPYNDEYYTGVAKRLSGAEREMLLSLPGGGFSIICEGGATVEFDGEFGFVYSKNDTFSQRAYTDITFDNVDSYRNRSEELSGSARRKAAQLAEELLRLEDSSENAPEAEITAMFRDKNNDLTYVFARQRFNDYLVSSHYAVCVFDGTDVLGAYGRWFFSDFGEVHSAELWDQINILFADMENLKNASNNDADSSNKSDGEDTNNGDTDTTELRLPSVKSMEACYAVYWNADKTSLYFIPAWLIEHSDGQAILYNALNGTVYSKK